MAIRQDCRTQGPGQSGNLARTAFGIVLVLHDVLLKREQRMLAAPAASFLRLYPKRPGPSLVPLFRACPPGRFR